MPYANELTALRAYLQTWPGLAGITIYRTRFPESQGATLTGAVQNGTPYAAVVIQSTGGGVPNNSYMDVSTTTKQLKVYAETPIHARQVWNECRAALKALHRNVKYDNTLLYGAVVGAPMEIEEDEPLNWPLCTSTFDLMAAETQ